MTLAAFVRPRLGATVALLGVTLLAGHDIPRERPVPRAAPPVPTIVALGKTIDPGPFADARAWPRGMVIAPPETGDRMATGVLRGPLDIVLSGLFAALGSLGA